MAEQNTEIDRKRPDDEPTKGEVLAVGGVIVAVVSGFVALVWADMKTQKKLEDESKERQKKLEQKLAEKQQWFNDENASGNIVYELRDGRYLVVPRVGEQKIVIK